MTVADDIVTKEGIMPDTKESRNKELVLKAFDALFNRRDYSEAERYWSPGYIQHSAHIKPGREGLSVSSKRYHRHFGMSRAQLWLTPISSSCMADSPALA